VRWVLGILDAYDPATGKRLWLTTAAPGEVGGKSWSGDSAKLGGGGTWLTGSYDPDLHLLYWSVGNPAPSFNPTVRKGDNLFTDSVVALDPDTGKLKWWYQFTPNDSHDWDSEEDLVLANQMVDGKPRKLLLHADRNGVFYVLDRTNGKFLWAKPFVKATWVKAGQGRAPHRGSTPTPRLKVRSCGRPPAAPISRRRPMTARATCSTCNMSKPEAGPIAARRCSSVASFTPRAVP
jgi:glucose dehydrogenase